MIEKKNVITNQEKIEKIEDLKKPMEKQRKRKEVKDKIEGTEVKEKKEVKEVKEKKTDKPEMVKSTIITEEETMITGKEVKENNILIMMEKKEKEKKEEKKVKEQVTEVKEVKVKNIEENLIKDNQKNNSLTLKNRVIMLKSLLKIKSLNDYDVHYLLYLIM